MSPWWVGGIALAIAVIFAVVFTVVYRLLSDGPPLFIPPRAEEAIAVAWAAMGMKTRPPSVAWETAGKRCPEDARMYLGYFNECVWGESWPYGGGSRVSWWKGAKFSECALAHELAHHARWERDPKTQAETEDESHAAIGADDRAGRAALRTWEEFA